MTGKGEGMKHMRLVGSVFSERDRETDHESRAREAHPSQGADDCDFYGDAEDEGDPFDSFDCAMDRNGQCGKAGSEECDWECPYQKLGLRR